MMTFIGMWTRIYGQMIKTGLIQINAMCVCTKCYGFSFYLVNLFYLNVYISLLKVNLCYNYIWKLQKIAQMIGEDVFIDPSLDYT